MSENEKKVYPNPTEGTLRRREFLKTLATVVALGYTGDQGSEVVAALLSRNSEVKFVPGQEKRFPKRSGVLVLGGFTVKDAKDIAVAVAPGLVESLGPVMYADYAGDDFDIQSLAKDLRKLKRENGLDRLSIYGQSIGTEVAGALVELIGDDFTFDTFFLDCTPTSLDDTRNGKYAKPLARIPPWIYNGGGFLTAVTNIVAYGNPLQHATAPPGLYLQELRTTDKGKSYIASVAKVAKRDNSNVIALFPHDPAKDTVVYDTLAKRHLRYFFPDMREYDVFGDKQGHANSQQNTEEYIRVLVHANKDSETIKASKKRYKVRS